MKICVECGGSHPLTDYHKKASNKDGRNVRCKSCVKIVSLRYRKLNGERYYSDQQAYRATETGFISQTVHNCRTRAKKKGFDFNIDAAYIKHLIDIQSGLCAVTGLPMNYESQSRKKANPFKCSVDRIDSAKGYVEDNIRLVCWAVNQMKSDRTEEEFVFWINCLHKAISSQAPDGEGSTTISQESREEVLPKRTALV